MKKLTISAAVIGMLALTGCSVATSYVDKGVEKLSADNVEAQFADVIRNWEGLTTAANNACQAGVGSTSEDGPVMVESAGMAYAATYRNIRQKYNAIQADIFKANLVGPPGYPKEIPNFPETNGGEPDFCAVAEQLYEMKE